MPEPDPAPRPLVGGKDALVLALGAILGGGGASAVFNPDWVKNIQFRFEIEGTFHLLAVAAAIGTVVGLGYSFYHHNGTFQLPRPALDRAKGTLDLSRLGFFGEVLFAVVFAVLAVWAKFPTAPPHIFTESTLAIAAGAALCGARMRCGYADRNVLRDALAQTVGLPAAPERKAAVEGAATSTQAALAAVGRLVLPASLSLLFEQSALPAVLAVHGKPIGRDAIGLTLNALVQHTVLHPALKKFVAGRSVSEVAAMDEAQFLAAVARDGIDVAAFRPALLEVHKAAKAVMEAFQTLPADWKLGG